MPPRTRSRRAERLELDKAGGRVNHTGLLAMPPEILYNIVSQFGCIPIPFQGPTLPKSIPEEFLERSQSLQSLTQTCQRLRIILLSLKWQKIEVGVMEQPSRRWDKTYSRRLAFELIEQLEIVTIRNPSLANHVREVSVWLGDYSASTVFPELARSLRKFSDLDTLQLICPGIQSYSRELRDTFEGQTFPHVKFLALKGEWPILDLFKSFPATRYCYSPYNGEHPWHWYSILDHWNDVVEIKEMAVPDKEILRDGGQNLVQELVL